MNIPSYTSIVMVMHETLRDLRLKAGLSQEQLADKLGWTQPAIARIEAGATDPLISTSEKILNVLGYELRIVKSPKRD